MSESGLHPVQTWLWSELDDLGIDGVIYSRHILDLLISSKHSVDYRLDKKEQSIFSKIAPGAKKRKHKYSRRSSSFSACEEILWKKEIAVACLLSAADTKTNSEDTASTIEQVVDELYGKLAGLHLTSDIKIVNSDGDSPLTDYNGNNVDTVDRPSVAKSKKKENYEDAFPSLDGGGSSPVSNEMSESIWSKTTTTKRTEPKSGHDSDNIVKSKPPQTDSKKTSKFSRFHGNITNKKTRFSSSKPHFTGSRSDDENPVISGPKRCLTYPLCPRNGNRQNRTLRKSRVTSTGCVESKSQGGASNQVRRPLRPKYTQNARFQPKRRIDSNKKNVVKTGAQKRKFANSGAVDMKLETDNGRSAPVETGLNHLSSGHEFGYGNGEFQQDYAHLPSWMETSLADVSNPYIWSAYQFETVGQQQESPPSEEDDGRAREMPFSSRWYRDPNSGLLTFQPLKSANSVSPSSASQSASSISEEDDEIFQEVDLDVGGGETAPESWMWCPSPSLWEDGRDSPVSRLQSVYKRELMSLGAESHVNDISGRIWEEYKTIFLDLQEMDDGSDHETSQSSTDDSGDDQPPPATNVWAFNNDDFPTPKADFAPNLDTIRPSVFDTPQKDSSRFDVMWTNALPSNFGGMNEKNYGNSSANFRPSISPVAGELGVGIGSGSESNIWGYSPMRTWSIEDDMPRSEVIHQDSELSLLMENGKFGYLCHGMAKKDSNNGWKDAPKNVWSVSPKPVIQHTVWGGGDTSPMMQKPDTPQDGYDERMMHNLVDALFSDLSFDLLFGSRETADPTHSEFEKMRRKTRFTPGFDPDYQTLSFDFRSLFVQTPIENFHSPENNPWQPRWDIDDLFSKAGFTDMSSFTRLDDIFESIAAEEDCRVLNPWALDHDTFDNGPVNKNTTFLDSVTENEAWKTSLRIGNIWQSISGIRPVNVIYSENKPCPSPDEKLIPSSDTHFRPIIESIGSEVNETPGFDPGLNMNAPMTTDEPVFCDTGQQQQHAQDIIMPVPITEISNIGIGNPDRPRPDIVEEPSFQVNFSKLGHDKSMQTAFEISVQQDISTCQDLLSRPPKANSR